MKNTVNNFFPQKTKNLKKNKSLPIILIKMKRIKFHWTLMCSFLKWKKIGTRPIFLGRKKGILLVNPLDYVCTFSFAFSTKSQWHVRATIFSFFFLLFSPLAVWKSFTPAQYGWLTLQTMWGPYMFDMLTCTWNIVSVGEMYRFTWVWALRDSNHRKKNCMTMRGKKITFSKFINPQNKFCEFTHYLYEEIQAIEIYYGEFFILLISYVSNFYLFWKLISRFFANWIYYYVLCYERVFE